jgi:hypothetical protein
MIADDEIGIVAGQTVVEEGRELEVHGIVRKSHMSLQIHQLLSDSVGGFMPMCRESRLRVTL